VFEAGVAVLWVQCAKVEELNGALEGCGDKLVHFDISSVEFKVADTIEQVCVPTG
jgi:hypothetical protein